MSKNNCILFCFISLSLVTTGLFAADDVSTYLVVSDIPPYIRLTETYDAYSHKLKAIVGYTIYSHPGILAGSDHFSFDHTDMTYETDYQSEAIGLGIEVQVVKHVGSDSDKWLRHEIDSSFRDYYGMPSGSYTPRLVNEQTILVNSVGGRSYRWLSGNKLIAISYRGSLRTLPEPIEVVQTYLVKHPSTMSTINLAQLRSSDNKTTWIKDEMERRLWLCDKWFMQLQLKKAEERQVYQESVKSMNIFLDYREKYYGLKGADEKNLLAGYLNTNNGTGIKAKLKEYKDWWVVNKDKAISL